MGKKTEAQNHKEKVIKRNKKLSYSERSERLKKSVKAYTDAKGELFRKIGLYDF